jgi:hypothetical protein
MFLSSTPEHRTNVGSATRMGRIAKKRKYELLEGEPMRGDRYPLHRAVKPLPSATERR